jgi:cell division control protein 6
MALKVGVEEVADEQALKLLSALAAQRGGDARYAIDVLRETVKLWIVRGGRITEDLVREASKRVESSYVVGGLRELSSSHKLMLLAALSSKTVGEAYKTFHEMAKTHGFPLLSERRLRDLLSDLEVMGYLSVRREGRKYFIEPSRWLPQDTVEVLKKELFPSEP